MKARSRRYFRIKQFFGSTFPAKKHEAKAAISLMNQLIPLQRDLHHAWVDIMTMLHEATYIKPDVHPVTGEPLDWE